MELKAARKQDADVAGLIAEDERDWRDWCRAFLERDSETDLATTDVVDLAVTSTPSRSYAVTFEGRQVVIEEREDA